MLGVWPPKKGGGKAAAAQYDNAVLRAYEKLAALDPLSHTQAAQCQFLLRAGGRGLRSQAKLAPAAWASSWAPCLAEVVVRSGVESLTDLETSELPLAAACRDALAELPAAAASDRQEDLLPSWSELAAEPRKT